MIKAGHIIAFREQAEDLNGSVVDGVRIMRAGVIPGQDLGRISAALQQVQGDWAKRTIDDLSPQSFPAFKP